MNNSRPGCLVNPPHRRHREPGPPGTGVCFGRWRWLLCLVLRYAQPCSRLPRSIRTCELRSAPPWLTRQQQCMAATLLTRGCRKKSHCPEAVPVAPFCFIINKCSPSSLALHHHMQHLSPGSHRVEVVFMSFVAMQGSVLDESDFTAAAVGDRRYGWRCAIH